jgi:chitin synthase
MHKETTEKELKLQQENAPDIVGTVYLSDQKNSKGDKPAQKQAEPVVKEFSMTSTRRRWLCFTWLTTWWIPSFILSCCGMKRPDVQLAWREKVALNIIVLFMCAVTLFYIIGLGLILCPLDPTYHFTEIKWRKSESDKPLATLRGDVFDLINVFQAHQHVSGFAMNKRDFYEQAGGVDLRYVFPVSIAECATDEQDKVKLAPITFQQLQNESFPLIPHNDLEREVKLLKSKFKVATLVWDPAELKKANKEGYAKYVVYKSEVFDVTEFVQSRSLSRDDRQLLFPDLGEELKSGTDVDLTQFMDRLPNDSRTKSLNCLRKIAAVGKIDARLDAKCQVPGYILLVSSSVLAAVILIKFFAALQLRGTQNPPEHARFLICQVPCYTEDEESLRKSIDSIAVSEYDDKHKLIFVTCDGMIIGSGNEKPTPRIVLDILGVDPNLDPEPLSYIALGEGSLQHNMAKVYSGLYEVDGHVVPYMVVVKCGTPREKSRPGNRGKRDSQLVLMQFLSKVHYDDPMAPLELEMYHHMANIIGVAPSLYEYVLMVDADTQITPMSLRHLITAMVDDSRIMGLCGETLLANNDGSWATMIQVYEYYISHHMAKAFESLFGAVTCLPGCFSIYRIRSGPALSDVPLLVSKHVLKDYAENNVDTLHKKNLLTLGEDRYLTTLLLKHFPKMRTSFTPSAKAETFAPDSWEVLLSQRRRWINSTVHNLFELLDLKNMCGFCLFSMRFVVFVDLIATLIQPTIMLYLIWLIVTLSLNLFNTSFPLISIIILASVYGLQAIIFILHRRFEQVGWMIIYILGLPLFSFFIPLYSFWHFDDFSWGNTRVVVGDGGKAQVISQDAFDPTDIPLIRWKEFENMHMQERRVSGMSGSSHATHESSVMQQAYRNSVSSYHSQGISQPRQSISSLHSQGFPHGLPPHAYSPSFYQNPYGSPHNVDARSDASFTNPHYLPHPSPSPQIAPDDDDDNVSLSSFQQKLSRKGSDGDYPSREELHTEIQRILSSSNLHQITKKQIREELAAYFAVSLSSKKKLINELINEVLQSSQ